MPRRPRRRRLRGGDKRPPPREHVRPGSRAPERTYRPAPATPLEPGICSAPPPPSSLPCPALRPGTAPGPAKAAPANHRRRSGYICMLPWRQRVESWLFIREAAPPEAREANGRSTASSACFLHIYTHTQQSPLDVSEAGCPIGELGFVTNNSESQSNKTSRRPGWD